MKGDAAGSPAGILLIVNKGDPATPAPLLLGIVGNPSHEGVGVVRRCLSVATGEPAVHVRPAPSRGAGRETGAWRRQTSFLHPLVPSIRRNLQFSRACLSAHVGRCSIAAEQILGLSRGHEVTEAWSRSHRFAGGPIKACGLPQPSELLSVPPDEHPDVLEGFTVLQVTNDEPPEVIIPLDQAD